MPNLVVNGIEYSPGWEPNEEGVPVLVDAQADAVARQAALDALDALVEE